MNKIIYKKANRAIKRNIIRSIGICISTIGLIIVLYIFSPMISWQLFYAPIFFSQQILAPIPQTIVANASANGSVTTLSQTTTDIFGGDSTNAQEWFPQYSVVRKTAELPPKVSSYMLSIPKVNIYNAAVTTIDNDLAKHMVNFEGTAVPPSKGTADIFCHSTLPQLFDPGNYRTICANVYKLSVGDTISVTINGTSYTYKIFSITVVQPDDTSVFIQNYDGSYLTLVTCTPPGTLYERLVIKSKLEES